MGDGLLNSLSSKENYMSNVLKLVLSRKIGFIFKVIMKTIKMPKKGNCYNCYFWEERVKRKNDIFFS